MANKITDMSGLWEGIAHIPTQQQADDGDQQPSDQPPPGSTGGALAFLASSMDGDSDKPALYQSEEGGLSATPPADRRELKQYRRGQFDNNRTFDFSKLPQGALAKDSVMQLTGHPVSATEFTNARAFLDTIAYSEGTSVIGFRKNGGAGYDVQVGGGIIGDLSWHPNQVIQLNSTLASSAAGRYQMLQKTWKEIAQKLQLKNFQPSSQDIGALFLLQRAGALDDVLAGNFEAAIHKARGVWASFPGAGYGQHENAMARLETFYRHSGGHMQGEPEVMSPEPKQNDTSGLISQNNQNNQPSQSTGSPISVAANEADQRAQRNQARSILAQHAPEVQPEQVAANSESKPDRRRDNLNVTIADAGKKPGETPSPGPKVAPGTNTALLA